MYANRLPFIVFLLVVSVCWAQENDFVRGRLLDLETGQPVVFATVRIKDKDLGVISNTDGGFQIPIKYKRDGEVLAISSMGYEAIEVPLVLFNTGTVLILNMKPALFELEEVTISNKRRNKESGAYNLTAREIVYKAIENLPLNVSQNPYSYVGYYRDYQIKDDNYINLNEALLQVFDQGIYFPDYETTKIGIFDYLQNKDFPKDSIGIIPYDYKDFTKTISNATLTNHGGNEFVILRVHDPIRNYNINSFDFVNKLNRDFTRNHTFSLKEDIIVDGSYVYHISLDLSYGKVDVKGDMYIAKNNFAIIGFDYLVYEKLPKRIGGNSLLFETKVEYEQHNGKMYLSYHSMNNSFLLTTPPKLQLKDVVFNRGKKQFIFEFNSILDVNSASKLSNYNVRFNGQKLKFSKVVIIDNEVALIPDFKNKKNRELFRELFIYVNKDKISSENLVVGVKRIKDEDGNIVNEFGQEKRNQFREFFVQELQINPTSIPKDEFYMDKSKPIFDNQPLNRPENFKDYWMNTPLKSIED